jgi:hypothetical protein
MSDKGHQQLSSAFMSLDFTAADSTVMFLLNARLLLPLPQPPSNMVIRRTLAVAGHRSSPLADGFGAQEPSSLCSPTRRVSAIMETFTISGAHAVATRHVIERYTTLICRMIMGQSDRETRILKVTVPTIG